MLVFKNVVLRRALRKRHTTDVKKLTMLKTNNTHFATVRTETRLICFVPTLACWYPYVVMSESFENSDSQRSIKYEIKF